MKKMHPCKQIEYNIKTHDDVHNHYEQMHGEIFNSVEQERLHEQLEQAIACIINRPSTLKKALDYGCGSGNLTKHLINLGLHVISADISDNFLEDIKQKFAHTGMSDILKINGHNLSNIENDCFDFVATYSVLHHVPDYLKIIEEMIRITKYGGIIYLDHEVNETYWNRNKEYVEFRRLSTPKKKWKRYFKLSNISIIRNKIRVVLNPRYQAGGDIHVFFDDHIDWNKIENLLIANECEIVLKKDYLLYKKGCPVNIYQEYKTKCNDTRVLIARKK